MVVKEVAGMIITLAVYNCCLLLYTSSLKTVQLQAYELRLWRLYTVTADLPVSIFVHGTDLYPPTSSALY